MEKKAGFGEVVKRMFTDPATAIPLLSMVAAPVIGAGVNAAVDKRKQINAAKEKTVAFRTMLDLHPHLKKRDAAEVSRIYSSLHNVNPILARDPMVAGAWVDNIIESKNEIGAGAANHALLAAVKDLSGIRNQLSGAMRSESSSHPAGQRFETMVSQLGQQLGRAYDHADKHALEVGVSKLEERERAQELRDKQLKARAHELRQQDEHLTTLASQLARFGEDITGEKKANDQDLERLFAGLGV